MGMLDFFRQGRRPSKSDDVAAEELFMQLARYGTAVGETDIHQLQQTYRDALEHRPEHARMEMLTAILEHVESRELGPSALIPFLLVDPSHAIVSTAALHAAALWPDATDKDPLGAVRKLVGHAEASLAMGDEDRTVGIFAGLLLTGDRRVTERLRNVWRELSPSGKTALSHMHSQVVHAPVIDWLLDWLEDCQGDEFGAVAAAIHRAAQQATSAGRVVEVERALPYWSRPDDQVVRLLSQWSVEEFADRICPSS